MLQRTIHFFFHTTVLSLPLVSDNISRREQVKCDVKKEVKHDSRY